MPYRVHIVTSELESRESLRSRESDDARRVPGTCPWNTSLFSAVRPGRDKIKRLNVY